MKKITVFDTEVSFFPSVYSKERSIQSRSLAELLFTSEWKTQVEQVRNETDAEKRRALKRELPCFTPSGLFSHNGAENLVRHSGFVCVDIDAKDNMGVRYFSNLKKGIAGVPYVAYCGYSVGGRGFFCLIPIADSAKHSDYYRSLVLDFEKCGITVDRACSNVCSKRFVSYDPEPYLNPDAKVYDRLPPVNKWVSVQTTRHPVFHSNDSGQRFFKALDQIRSYGVDITKNYKQWFEVLCSIAAEFGESGRTYAHEVSRHYSGYSERETDRQYDKCLRHHYGYTLGTFYYYVGRELLNLR